MGYFLVVSLVNNLFHGISGADMQLASQEISYRFRKLFKCRLLDREDGANVPLRNVRNFIVRHGETSQKICLI